MSPVRFSSKAILVALPVTVAGCQKLGPDQITVSNVTLTGTATAPAVQLGALDLASPAVMQARRGGQPNVPLAFARVQALDAGLQPIPGIAEARTDAGGRFMLNVPSGRPYVLRFSLGDDEKKIALMTVARPTPGESTNVVNADAASHVATGLILGRSGGLDEALSALGAPDLQELVDIVRRNMVIRETNLDSKQVLDGIISEEPEKEAITGVLSRVDRAAAAAVARKISPPSERAVASATGSADVAAQPAPTPSPRVAASTSPAAAVVFRVEESSVLPAVTPQRIPPRHSHLSGRRHGLEIDPFHLARESARVPAASVMPGILTRVARTPIEKSRYRTQSSVTKTHRDRTPPESKRVLAPQLADERVAQRVAQIDVRPDLRVRTQPPARGENSALERRGLVSGPKSRRTEASVERVWESKHLGVAASRPTFSPKSFLTRILQGLGRGVLGGAVVSAPGLYDP